MAEGPRSSPTIPLPRGAAASGTAPPGTPAGRRSGSARPACGGPGARTSPGRRARGPAPDRADPGAPQAPVPSTRRRVPRQRGPLVFVLPSTVSSWCRPLKPDPASLPHEQPIGGAVGPAWPASGSSGCPDAPPARRARTAGRSRAARTPNSRAGRAPRENAPFGRDRRGAAFWRAERLWTRAPAARVGAPDPGRRRRPGGRPPAGRAASVPGHD